MSSVYSQFSLGNPKFFDGDPYEVASRSVAQANGLAKLLSRALEDVWLMARNAELERHEEPNPRLFENGPQGRLYDSVQVDLAKIIHNLGILEKAAAYNPKAR